jgi:hypothetical protein
MKAAGGRLKVQGEGPPVGSAEHGRRAAEAIPSPPTDEKLDKFLVFFRYIGGLLYHYQFVVGELGN